MLYFCTFGVPPQIGNCAIVGILAVALRVCSGRTYEKEFAKHAIARIPSLPCSKIT